MGSLFLTKVVIVLIEFILLMVIHYNKGRYIELFEMYRPKWFPDCVFCFAFWNGVFFSSIFILTLVL